VKVGFKYEKGNNILKLNFSQINANYDRNGNNFLVEIQRFANISRFDGQEVEKLNLLNYF
jgi:hypothetical protein